MTRIAMVSIVLALSGCASQPEAPDWVSGAPREYRSSEYLIGRGQGASGEEARDRARADLAKVFEAQVSADSVDEQSFKDARYEARSLRRVSVRAERVVEGVEIARTWQEPSSGSHHALAVLPRAKAANALREEIARLDEATRVHAGRSRDAQDLFLKISFAGQALAAQAERHACQKALRVVDPTGVGEPSSWSVERLRADLDALLKRVKLAPRVVRDTSESLEPLHKAATAAAGFLADTGASPDYILEASLVLEATGPLEDWYWQRGVLEVRLVEAASGRSRGSRRWPIKAAALGPQLAVQRALSEVDAALRKDLRAAVIGFAASSR